MNFSIVTCMHGREFLRGYCTVVPLTNGFLKEMFLDSPDKGKQTNKPFDPSKTTVD